MEKLQQAISTLHHIDREAAGRSSISSVHPAARLFVTVLFIFLTVSYQKYVLSELLSMVIYLIITGIWNNISTGEGLRRFRYLVVLLLFVGIANPFFDRQPLYTLGMLTVTGGMVSMLTLFLKGFFAMYASYELIMLVGMNGICRALHFYHVPSTAVTVLMLIYRYLIVLLKEVMRMTQAYHLRAPRQKGIQLRAWGSFVGLLLLRSIDRAQEVYDSMLLRGYHGVTDQSRQEERVPRGKKAAVSLAYVVIWTAVLILLRVYPIFRMIGRAAGF